MNYHVARNGQQLGVFSATDISLKLSSGDLSPQDLAWTDGMPNWQPISAISGLSFGSGSTPPALNPYAAPSASIYQPQQRSHGAELASLGQRLGAHLLDSLTILPFFIACVIGAAFADPKSSRPESEMLLMLPIAAGFLYLIGLMIYNLIRLANHGQTLGKKWVGIRIVNLEDDNNAGFVKAVLLRSIVNFILVFVIPFYGMVDPLFIFGEERRCLHDLIASTRVVKV